ncbi:MAG: hypothetical protein WC459_02790 [Patescibacteria group bacterium]
MKKYLFINTVNPSLPSFAFFSGEGEDIKTLNFIDKQEDLNKNLDLFFKGNKLKAKDIKAVMVISGPGSFSGGRAGVVLANSFNFLYKIPVLGIKDEGLDVFGYIKKHTRRLSLLNKSSVAEVYYNREPDITLPKKS